MTNLIQQNPPSNSVDRALLSLRESSKQELRYRINSTLQMAKHLPPLDCLQVIKSRLSEIQADCRAIGKTFIVVEEAITCDQYDLGGLSHETATLLRGPSRDASVAICVTDRGSLLHRNGVYWKIYRDAGDVSPLKQPVFYQLE